MESIREPQTQRRLRLPSLRESERLGANLAAGLARGHLLVLRGDLGVGKTTLARAIIAACLAREGCSEAIPSPSFSLMQRYETSALILTHADLYRIDSPLGLRELDLEGALEIGALLVEWPRFLDGLQPRDRLEIRLDFEADASESPETEARWAHLAGFGIWSENLRRRDSAIYGLEDFLL